MTLKRRPSKFLFVFELRQGAILIAVENIAVSSCTLVTLLVGIGHALETVDVLNADMEDNAEREGAEGLFRVTNNQRKFRLAYHLAAAAVFFLYASLVGTAAYLAFCVGLFYGAAKRRKEYVVPWIVFASLSVPALAGATAVGDGSDTLVEICGGRDLYRVGGLALLAGHVYCIATVAGYARELDASDAERGEDRRALVRDRANRV